MEISSKYNGNGKEREENSKSQFDMHGSNLSSEGFKQSVIEISENKPVDTTIKKAKLIKSNIGKNKKNLFEKQQRAHSRN